MHEQSETWTEDGWYVLRSKHGKELGRFKTMKEAKRAAEIRSRGFGLRSHAFDEREQRRRPHPIASVISGMGKR